MTATLTTHTELDAAWRKLEALVRSNREVDNQEVEAAIQMSRGNLRCEDVKGFKRLRDQVFTQLDAAIATAERVVAEFAAKDVAGRLLERKESWNHVTSELTGVRTDVEEHSKLDDWQGSGAQSYQKLLPTQLKALDELKGLAISQQRACDQLALINAAMFQAALDSLRQITNLLRVSYPTQAVIGPGKRVRGHRYLDAPYCDRTYAAIDLLRNFTEWYARQSQLDTADWRDPALKLDKTLLTTTGATIVLEHEGGWPSIGTIVDAEAADTAQVTAEETTVGRSARERRNGKIDFN